MCGLIGWLGLLLLFGLFVLDCGLGWGRRGQGGGGGGGLKAYWSWGVCLLGERKLQRGFKYCTSKTSSSGGDLGKCVCERETNLVNLMNFGIMFLFSFFFLVRLLSYIFIEGVRMYGYKRHLHDKYTKYVSICLSFTL